MKTTIRSLVCILSGLILSSCAAQTFPTITPSVTVEAVEVSNTPFATLTPAALPTPAPSATSLPCTEEKGSDTSFEVNAAKLEKPLQVRVHRPPCFDSSGKTRYPVLYLLHGQGFNNDQWERLGAQQELDRLTAAGEILPMLLVLPAEGDTNANPFESPFSTAFIDALVPTIDRTFPTCPQRECRAIGGLSRGASWAVYLAFSNPELFTAAGAHSLPPFHGLEERLADLISAVPAGQIPSLYLDIGVSDLYRAPASSFEKFLNQAGIPHEWYLNRGNHDEVYWSAHVEEYLRWYARQLNTDR